MKHFLLSLFLLAPVFAFSQSNFRPGYAVTNSGDTLKGYINYKERSVNPSSFIFESALKGKTQEFNLQNCAAYGITGAEDFQRYKVAISGNKLEVTNLSIGLDSSSRTDTVFLKVVQAGKHVSLYAYRDAIKSRFYTSDQYNEVPAELIYQIYMSPERVGAIVTENKYAGQLLRLMEKFNAGTAADKKSLRELRYSEKEILKIISMINDQQIVKSKYAASRFFLGAGLMYSKAKYYGQNDLANSAAKSKSSYSPVLTAGIDLFSNPAIGKLIYRVELSFFTSKGDISTTTSDVSRAELTHTFDQKTAVLTPQLIYNIYNSNFLKAFIGIGFGFNYSGYSNNKSTRFNSFRQELNITDNEVKFENFNLSIPVKAGIVIHKKIELSAGYSMPSSVTNYTYYNIRFQRLNIGVNYLFGKS